MQERLGSRRGRPIRQYMGPGPSGEVPPTVVLPDVPVGLDGPFDAVALERARALGLDVVELVKMRAHRRLLRAGLPSRYEVEPASV